MRHDTRTAGPLLIAAVLMAGCGTGPGQLAVSEPAAPVETTIATTATTRAAATTPAPVQETPTTTTTTTTAVNDEESGLSNVDPADVDELLAEMEASLAGLDQLMNNAAAGMAAQEGEIIP